MKKKTNFIKKFYNKYINSEVVVFAIYNDAYQPLNWLTFLVHRWSMEIFKPFPPFLKACPF